MTATMTRNKRKMHDEYVQQTCQLQLWGEIISWNAGPGQKDHKAIVQALCDEGLDKEAARELHVRHAFSRACRALCEERIIDIAKEDDEMIYFQFTRRYLENEEIEYRKETTLTLNKNSGLVECPMKELASQAQAELDRCLRERTSSDITRIVQWQFDRHADLWPIRDQGGVYFVPEQHREFTGRIERFLGRLGGRLKRFPVPAGTQTGDRDVKETATEGIKSIIADYQKSVQSFGLDTRESTIKTMAEKIKLTRHKIEAYRLMLSDRQVEVEKALDAANKDLAARVNNIAKARDNDDETESVVECDHCHAPQKIKDGTPKVKCVECHKTFSIEWGE